MSASQTRPLAILLMGDAPLPVRGPNGNFDDMFLQLGDIDPAGAEIINLPQGERPRGPEHYRGAIVTGSPAMVTDALPWSEQTAVWLRQAADAGLPLFGTCYGHQLMAYAFGGEVGYHPQGMEIGTLEVELLPGAQQDPLLKQMPVRFRANMIHAQSVLRVPEGATVLARSAHDAHQAIRYRPNVFSTQFHPEFSGAVMQDYLTWIESENPENAALYRERLRTAADTPESRGILQTFVKNL
ncbi:glutamine amidotransferase [Enterobacillus tribolii]|uniref:GMP synthase (Glutamine-hydrolysing) n=1 Tax=Enterobacillus tribolii TaxID=1487935 RepID=A0A370R1C8_9GAMM|nr:glutamine amidotransferase [Enterobacillus tribolii]MBW7982720.1 glutamine amidotransferase [Enterobacillus tribolii]RDK95718.1 GMP synthase (glutamine-hydrolysing) [Enterobacillus tribolii]